MGSKVKGGMWCDICQKPVAGQKSTAKVAKVSATALSGGMYPGLPGGYHCPTCGSPVRRRSSGAASGDRTVMIGLAVGVVVIVLIVAGIVALVHSFRGPRTVPDVRSMNLSDAKAALHQAGLGYAYNSNQGLFGIVDESNWVVCGESPAPGTKTKHTVYLDVRHFSCGPGSVSGHASRTSTIKARLVRAGYKAEGQGVGGRPVPAGSLRVTKGGFQVMIYVYNSASDARSTLKTFALVQRSRPKQIAVKVVGPVLYVGTTQEPAVLPLSEFEQVVSAAEGR